MEKSDALAALAALAQDHRLETYRLLVQAGPEGMPAGEVAAAIGLPPNTLTFHFDRLRQVLNELKSEGRLQDVDTTVATFSLLGMINWLSRWFKQDGALTEEQIAEEIVKIALSGLLRPSAHTAQPILRVVKD